MKELLRTNDEVHLSYVTAMLRGEGIEAIVFDRDFSVMDGSIGVLPRRLMVADEDYDDAMDLLEALAAEDGA